MKIYKYRSKGRGKRNNKSSTVAELLFILFLLVYVLLDDKFIKYKTAATYLIAADVLLLLMIAIVPYIKNAFKKRNYLNSNIEKIDRMTGEEFEEYLKAHFQAQGYSVQLTPATNDYGADLVLIKNGIKTVVQAKRYNGKVGNKAIQEVSGAISYYHAAAGMVITNSYFTANAQNLAHSIGITLWNRNKLMNTFTT